jgi:general secretion pathway protein D
MFPAVSPASTTGGSLPGAIACSVGTHSSVQAGSRRRTPARWLMTALACLLLAVLLSGCAAQRVRDNAQELLNDGRYEQANAMIEKGLVDHPGNPILRAGLVRTRNEALTRLLNEAAMAKSAGRLDDAEKTLRRAVAFDTSERRVQSLLAELTTERRQAQALADATALADRQQLPQALQLLNDALKDNPRQPDLRALQRRLEIDQRQAQVRASQQGLRENRRISLDFRDASLRTVLDLVSRNSGINFVIDKDIRSDIQISVYLKGARVEDALDLITSTHQLAKKVVDAKTVLIYPNTPEKQREHQEQVVRVFYLASAEAKGAAAFLRAMLRVKEPFVDERTNMVALRDSPENVALAERLIALYDTHDPEVLLEVEVIEVRANRLTEIGVKFPESASLSIIPPVGGLTLGNLSSIGKDAIAVGIGGMLFNLRREVGDFNTLANPSIRVRNREKAKVLIGDKVPVITSTVATGGFVSDSVSYVEVGLKLEVEPTVFADDDVAIKVALESSTLAREIRTPSGTLAYQIGTRTASTVLRLRDGETQLLAGLISREDRSSGSRLPGVGDLPMLGRLFSNQQDESVRTELVLAITPRVLRNVRRPEVSETEMWIGTESLQRLRPVRGFMDAATEPADAAAPAGVAPASATPAGARPPANGTTAGPVPVAPAVGGPASTVGGSGSTDATAAAALPPTLLSSAARLKWSAPAEVRVGESFVVNLMVDTPVALRGAPLSFTVGPGLELVKVEEGDFFKQGGAATHLTQAADVADRGGWNLGILRGDLSGAVGQGTVVSLRLKAVAAGTAQVGLKTFEPMAVQGVPPAKALPSPVSIKVN